MVIFTWIFLGLAGLLFTASAVFWVLFIVADDSGWHRLSKKVGRIGFAVLLFYINVAIYKHVVGVFVGTAKPVPAIISGEDDEVPAPAAPAPASTPSTD